MQTWVTTKDAERILGIKRQTLKRKYANPETGFLIEGTHWKRGMYHSSTSYWDIILCNILIQHPLLLVLLSWILEL